MTNPLPLSCMLLVPALPGVYALGLFLTDWLTAEPRIRHLLASCTALATWLVAVATAARAAGSFTAGLWVGTLIVAAVGLASWLLRGARSENPAPAGSWRASRPMLLSGLAVTLPVAFLAVVGDFFDEFLSTGHRSLIAQFQNGIYPPRHQVFPDYPFHYHYGFNVVGAALTGLFRIPVAWAIDFLTVAGFFWSWCLAWRLGERLTPSRDGRWAALASLAGGGAFFWFIWYSDWVELGAIGIVIGGNRINFPVIMYYFQKPFILGFPLALAVMLVVSVRPGKQDWWRRCWMLALLLGALSLTQSVLFVTLAACVVAQDLVTERRLRALIPVALAVGLALLMGGVFSSLARDDMQLVRARFWPAHEPPGEVLGWYFLTTGLLVPLGFAALLLLPRMRVFFLCLMVGSFSVPLFFANPHTWDIVKFVTVGQFAAGLVGGSALARLAEKRTRLRMSALAILLILIVASPVGYVGYWIKEHVRPGHIGNVLQSERNVFFKEEWLNLIVWVRENAPLDGAIYTGRPRFGQLMRLGGLFTSGPTRWMETQFGIPAQRLDSRSEHNKSLPREIAAWLNEGIYWVVTGPGEPLNDTVSRWVEAGQAREETSSGKWKLYRLIAPQTAMRGRP